MNIGWFIDENRENLNIEMSRSRQVRIKINK